MFCAVWGLPPVQVNSRKIHDEVNVLEGLMGQQLFLAILGLEAALQVCSRLHQPQRMSGLSSVLQQGSAHLMFNLEQPDGCTHADDVPLPVVAVESSC